MSDQTSGDDDRSLVARGIEATGEVAKTSMETGGDVAQTAMATGRDVVKTGQRPLTAA